MKINWFILFLFCLPFSCGTPKLAHQDPAPQILEKDPSWVTVDTLLSQAVDATKIVVGQRNLPSQQQGSIEVKILQQLSPASPDKKDSLIAIAYWIGIGGHPISEYDALAEGIPPEWAQPGVSAPLAAYGLGHQVILPDLPSGSTQFEQEEVRFDFVSQQERGAFSKNGTYSPLIRRNSYPPNYGILRGGALRDLQESVFSDPDMGKDVLRFHLAFANQHPINSYQVVLKVVCLYEVLSWE